MTQTSQYRFVVKEGVKGTSRIALEPSGKEKELAFRDLGLDLQAGTTPVESEKLARVLNAKVSRVSYTNRINTSDVDAGWVIGSYLILHTLLLVGVSLLVWLAHDWRQFFVLAPFLDAPNYPMAEYKFRPFQQLVLSACAAGLGGGVFMIREFFIKFSYGKENEYLKRKEIPRYVLLPFSSVVLGPISLVLAKAGAMTFVGLSPGKEVPIFTLVALGFVLGYTYHDTLAWLASLSKKIFVSKKSDKSESSN